MEFKNILKQENKKYIVTLLSVSLLFFLLYFYQTTHFVLSEKLVKFSVLLQSLGVIATMILLVLAYNKFDKVSKEQKKLETNNSEKENIYIKTRKYQHKLIFIAMFCNFVGLAITGMDFFMYLFCMAGIFALMTFFSQDSFVSNFTTTYEKEQEEEK